MKTPIYQANAGYSPSISMRLSLHGETFDVASIGPTTIIVRQPRLVKPGVGTVTLNVDGRITLYSVELLQGLDPARSKQPISVLSSCDEEVAA